MAINFRELLLSLLREYDPALDLEDDAPIVTDVVDPLVSALRHDPFSPNISKFIRARLQQEADIVIRDGSALDDMLDKSMQAILEPYRREIHRVSLVQSFKNVGMMTDADVDGLSANRFVTRAEGDYAQARVRAYFYSPQAKEILPDNLARTDGGLVFIPTQRQSITIAEMSLNRDGSLYYMDISYIAEEPGEEYNVAKNTILAIDGVNAVRVTNLSAAAQGIERDSNTEMMIRAADAQSQKSLVSRTGIAHVLADQFENDLRLIFSLGRGDPEMQRDIITAVGDFRAELKTWVVFPVVIGASNQKMEVATDDATRIITIAAATYTDIFTLAAEINTKWLAAGGNSYIATPWKDYPYYGILFHSDTVLVGIGSTLAFLAETNNAYGLFRLDQAGTQHITDIIGDVLTGGFSGVLQLDDIPGGILDPNTPNGDIITPGSQVHVGAGAADIYAAPRNAAESSLTLPLIEHDDPSNLKTNMQTTASSNIVEVDLADWNDVETGNVLALYTGADAGLYVVLDKSSSGGSYYLRLEAPGGGLTATGTVSWGVVVGDRIAVDLWEPFTTRVKSTALEGTATQAVVSHASINFSDLGVTVDDTLEILSGDNAGVYSVVSLPTPTSIQLDRTLVATDSAMDFRIYNEDDPIEMPIRDVTEVEETDSSGRPTGNIIPYALPVDAQVVGDFSNYGNGMKTVDTVSTVLGDDELTFSGSFADDGLAVGDRVYIGSGEDEGYYRLEEIISNTVIRVNALMTDTASSIPVLVGAPSVGNVRLYFPDPTSFEVYGRMLVDVIGGQADRPGTRFSYQATPGSPIYYFEGGPFYYQRVPEINGTHPATLNKVSDSVVSSADHDFNAWGVRPGDRLQIETGASGGTYTITDVDEHELTVSGSPFAAGVTNDTFNIYTTHTQGMQTLSMSEQGLDGPFYYMDVELVSMGAGDVYNIERGAQLQLVSTSNYYNEGWWMTTNNSNLSYSVYEEPKLMFTPHYLPDGLPETRINRTLLQGIGVKVSYMRPDLIAEMQTFSLNGLDRVICEDPLVRHLLPVFVYMGFDFSGGSAEDVVRRSLKEWVENLIPEEDLKVYDIMRILRKRGVVDVTGALEVLGMQWNADRSISVARSTDRIDTGRVSSFIVMGGELTDVRRV